MAGGKHRNERVERHEVLLPRTQGDALPRSEDRAERLRLRPIRPMTAPSRLTSASSTILSQAIGLVPGCFCTIEDALPIILHALPYPLQHPATPVLKQDIQAASASFAVPRGYNDTVSHQANFLTHGTFEQAARRRCSLRRPCRQIAPHGQLQLFQAAACGVGQHSEMHSGLRGNRRA